MRNRDLQVASVDDPLRVSTCLASPMSVFTPPHLTFRPLVPFLVRPPRILGGTAFPLPRLQVESEESANQAKLRALFPDYHSGFKDLIVDSGDVTENEDEAGGDENVGADAADTGGVDARAKALGHMSDKQLSSIVARHCRIFLSAFARRRGAVRAVLATSSSSSSSRRGRGKDGLSTGVGSSAAGAGPQALCSDAERLLAFEDCYRASVLLVEPTSRLSSSAVLPAPASNRSDVGARSSPTAVLEVEEAFSASHLLALADAARLCRSGRSLLEDVAGGPTDEATGAGTGAAAVASKKHKRDKPRAGIDGVSGAPWLGEGAAGRNLLLVDPLVHFHLDSNVGETRLADGPLAAVLRRVAALLGEFPGHGVLIQVSKGSWMSVLRILVVFCVRCGRWVTLVMCSASRIMCPAREGLWCLLGCSDV